MIKRHLESHIVAYLKHDIENDIENYSDIQSQTNLLQLMFLSFGHVKKLHIVSTNLHMLMTGGYLVLWGERGIFRIELA